MSERAARPASEGVKSANTPDSESTNAPQSPVSVIDSIPEWAWWVFAIVMFVLGFSTFGVPTILVWTAIGVSLLAGYSYYESRYVPAHEQTINLPSATRFGSISIALLVVAYWWGGSSDPGSSTALTGTTNRSLPNNYQSGAAPSRPLALSDGQIADQLVGAWRHTNQDGLSATFSFERNGTFTYYVSSTNPIANWATTSSGSLGGRWSVRDGMIAVEYLAADNAIVRVALVGTVARSPVLFLGRDSVQLKGIEGESLVRVYNRIR